MRDREPYRRVLGIERPWQVPEVALSLEAGEVKVQHVAVAPGADLACPVCGRVVPRYDRRYREWRHLDTWQFRTILAAEVPRVSCPEHGVRQVAVPWAETGSGYTGLPLDTAYGRRPTRSGEEPVVRLLRDPQNRLAEFFAEAGFGLDG